MNVKAALDMLMSDLRRDAPELRAYCLQKMALIQETELETAENLPWFLMSEEATAVTTPGESRLELPSDFIREVEDDNLYLVQEDGTLVDIHKRGYDEGRHEISDNAEAGVPQLYSIRGDYIILRPAPDLEYPIRFPSYYARQPAPVDNISSQNAWFKWAADLMIAKAGVVVAGMRLKDTELVSLFGAQQQRAVQRLEHMETAREEANRSRRMG